MAAIEFTPIPVKYVAIDLFWLCERHVAVTRRVERVIRWAGRER